MYKVPLDLKILNNVLQLSTISVYVVPDMCTNY